MTLEYLQKTFGVLPKFEVIDLTGDKLMKGVTKEEDSATSEKSADYVDTSKNSKEK